MIRIALALILAAMPAWGQPAMMEKPPIGVRYSEVLTKPTFLTILSPRGNIVISLDAKPMTVDLGGNTPDEAAKAFWNAVMTVTGRPPMFPVAPP